MSNAAVDSARASVFVRVPQAEAFVLEVTFAPRGTGTHVTVTHRGWSSIRATTRFAATKIAQCFCAPWVCGGVRC